ncbi:MAG TPA: hypothetical protein PLS50_06785, partial [Candidatus Dojkabacteria bacterium]|nr:hypothetical protein [Candidatus Dojkabacteria bacterium]
LPVDAKEVFIYKLLSILGFGEEPHFLCNPEILGCFYIATRDLAYSEDKEVKKYLDYCDLKELWPYWENKEGWPGPAEYESFTNGLLLIDYFSRVLGLSDVLTDDENAGFLYNQTTGTLDPKIVGFRVPNLRDSVYDTPDVLAQFFNGKSSVDHGEYASDSVLRALFGSNEEKVQAQN